MNYLVSKLGNPNWFAVEVVELSGIGDESLSIVAVKVEGDSINLIINQVMCKTINNLDQLGNQCRLGRNQPSSQDQPDHSCKQER